MRRFHHTTVYFCLVAGLIAGTTPGTARAQTDLGVGFTGQHGGQSGSVIMLDYKPATTIWDVTLGSIQGTRTRDTSWVALSDDLIDRDLFAGFGLALITRQTTTLTSPYQFMTTFGYHHDGWVLSVRHLSNGGLRGVNIGENLIVLSWDF
jgi:hypothetical protein